MNALIAIVFMAAAVFGACLLGTAVGATAGWIVGLVFDQSMFLLAKMLGIPDAAPYQLGAIFGFIGGFFRSSIMTRK